MPIIENNGILEMSNGTITTNGTQGAINVKQNASFTISGGSIIATGTRQAVYNDGGYVEITGTAYLSGASTERAPVHNTKGTMAITGGTIVSSNYHAVDINAGTVTIGTKDGSVSTQSPVIQGSTYAVSNRASGTPIVNFYDGILKGKMDIFNDSKVTLQETETNYIIFYGTEQISGQTYKTAILGPGNTVTFDANGGTLANNKRGVPSGTQIGTLPTPTWTGNQFVGWFTAKNGGEQIGPDRIITADVTFYAHWIVTNVAEMNGTQYATLAAAISKVPTDGTKRTITLLRDTTENVRVSANRNIELDLQGYTITPLNLSANNPIIDNHGTLLVTNGTLTTSGETAAINNNNTNATNNSSGASLTIDGVTIISTGTRQAIYNYGGGIVVIKGNSYLSSTTSGLPSQSTMERGTVHNVSGGNVTILGGTIIGVNQQAVSNEGTVTIGTKDGTVSTTVPEMRGKVYGIKNAGTLNFYDGIAKGKTDAIVGTISDVETNYQKVDGTETIDGQTYKTAILGEIEEEPEQEPQETPEEEPEEELQENTEEGNQEDPEQESQETTNGETQEEPEQEPQGTPEEETQEEPGHESQGTTEEGTQENPEG